MNPTMSPLLSADDLAEVISDLSQTKNISKEVDINYIIPVFFYLIQLSAQIGDSLTLHCHHIYQDYLRSAHNYIAYVKLPPF